MPSLSFNVILFIVFVIIYALLWRGRMTYVPGTSVVLKEFKINTDLATQPAVKIAGRTSGILSWLMTTMGVDPQVEFVVTNSEVSIRTGSLSGVQHICIPMAQVSAAVCGYQRSILALACFVVFALGFIGNLFFAFAESNHEEVNQLLVFVVLAAIAIAIYALTERIVIVLETMHPHGVAFKRSVIEGVSVDLKEALQVIAVINARLLAAQPQPTGPLPQAKGVAAGAV